MKKILLVSISITIVILLGYLFFQGRNNADPFTTWNGEWKTYHNQKHQFALEYPGYFTPQEFSEGSKDIITFLTKFNDKSFSPENGGMSIIIEPTDFSSGEEWFSKNKDNDAPLGILILDKRIVIAGQPALVIRYAEKSGDDLSPTPEQKTLFVGKQKLFTINGVMDFNRVWSSFKFLE